MLTAIRGAAAVVFDSNSHHVLPSGVVIFRDQHIESVGLEYRSADKVIDARDCLLVPGFVNVHSHGGSEAGGRLILDCGRPDAFNTGYMNVQTARPGKRFIGERAGAEALLGSLYYLAECVRHGATTVVNVGQGNRELIEAAVKIGVRVYAGPRFASARYVESQPGRIDYEWDEACGEAGLAEACQFVHVARQAGEGLVHGLLCPHAADTCSEKLLKATSEAAAKLDVRIQIHAAQGLFEFTEMLRRTQQTPIRWLHEIGFLNPQVILGHAMFLDHHPLAPAPGRVDLDLLASSGAHVAHCPLVFARRGWALHSFDRYRRAGVNIGLGTDTCPRDIIDEMRWASYVSKMVEGDYSAGQPADVFTAAALGGARALGRTDLGALQAGARADLVAVRLDALRMGPVFDPVRSLLHYATGAGVEHVWVDGRHVVEHGRVLGIDERALMADVQRMSDRHWAGTPRWEGSGRSASEMCPPAFPVREESDPGTDIT